MKKILINNVFFQVCVLYFGLLTETLGHRGFSGPYKYPILSDLSESISQKLFPVPYGESSRYLYRNSEERRDVEVSKIFNCGYNQTNLINKNCRHQLNRCRKTCFFFFNIRILGRKKNFVCPFKETRPLCEEERKSQNIRELIQSSNSNFLQTGNNLDIRKYNLIPRKVDVIKCVSTTTDEKSSAVCKPENCRERKGKELATKSKKKKKELNESEKPGYLFSGRRSVRPIKKRNFQFLGICGNIVSSSRCLRMLRQVETGKMF